MWQMLLIFPKFAVKFLELVEMVMCLNQSGTVGGYETGKFHLKVWGELWRVSD